MGTIQTANCRLPHETLDVEMKVHELINHLLQFPDYADIQMRDLTGDWTADIDIAEIGLFVYIQGQIEHKNESDLEGLAAREAQR